jgi:hypothetical protein
MEFAQFPNSSILLGVITETRMKKTEIPVEDKFLRDVKRDIQRESREAVSSGRLKQTDLFLISPELARRAKITLKA